MSNTRVPQTQQPDTVHNQAHHWPQFWTSILTISLSYHFYHFIFSSIQRNNVLSRHFEL